MSKKAAYAWAAAGLIVPAVILLDLNLFKGGLSSSTFVLLVVWPSSFVLSGFNEVNIGALAALAISVSINVLLYLVVGGILSRMPTLLGRVLSPTD